MFSAFFYVLGSLKFANVIIIKIMMRDMVKGCPNLGYYTPKSDGRMYIAEFKIQTLDPIRLEFHFKGSY